MSVSGAVKYQEMTDEQIAAIKRRIETFVKSEEFFDKFCNHEKWERGSQTMKSRRVVRPLVKLGEDVPAKELEAPRPLKIAVQTFEHKVDIYRDKVAYSAEDIIYGYDDIVKICGDTLAEVGVQKLDLIKGKPFISSACTASAETTLEGTLSKVAIILQKNKAKPWHNGRYLAIVTPETLEAVRTELKGAGSYISEPTKEDIDSGLIGHYGRWDFAVCPSELLIKNASTQYMVCMGKRPNGLSPIDVAKIDGVEVIHNPLGSGVLEDVDGNLTSDDNKQKGSVAMNINGLGAYVNDDLCVIDVEVSVAEIGKSELDADKQTGYQSGSPIAEVIVEAKYNGAAAEVTKTFKLGSSTGESVNESALKVGVKYYMSVADASSHTATATFVARPQNYFSLTLE